MILRSRPCAGIRVSRPLPRRLRRESGRTERYTARERMALADRWNDLRRGFHRTFWIANTLELFERFAFYGSKAVLAVYLAEKVALGPQLAGTLVGAFSGILYFLPVLAGTLVDRYGFKRTLAACFAIF